MNAFTPQELIHELNRIFAEEVEAAIRYLHLAHAVRGLERLGVERVLREGFEETIQHAGVIAQKIRALGQVPRLEVHVSCPPEPLTAAEALRTALTFEEAALEGYQELLARIGNDVSLEEFIRSQIAAESEHVAQLRELLAE